MHVTEVTALPWCDSIHLSISDAKVSFPLLAAWLRCWCNGRSRYCLRDPVGLHCVDCQGNTEGRHCERCKDGFYKEKAELACTRCGCNVIGELLVHTHTHTYTYVFVLSLITSDLLAQAQSVAVVTAGGAATVRKESRETNVTNVHRALLEQPAVPSGEHTILLYILVLAVGSIWWLCVFPTGGYVAPCGFVNLCTYYIYSFS